MFPLLVASYAAGIACADGLPSRAAFAIALLAAVCASCALAAGGRRARGIAAIGLTFVAGVVVLRTPIDLAEREAPLSSQEVLVEGRVCEAVRSRTSASIVLCGVEAVDGSALPRRVRVIERQRPEALTVFEHGDRVRAAILLAPLRDASNPGQRSWKAASLRRGIGASGRLVHPDLIVALSQRSGDRFSPGASLRTLRRRVADRLIAQGRGGGLLAALAVGERRGLASEDRERFVGLGIAHLLAVSGLHLALFAGAAYAALRGLAVRATRWSRRFDVRRAALAVALCSACGYALLTGFAVPVQRALAFLVALASARLLQRSADPVAMLGVAAALVLTLDPAALFEPGPQLSFAASAALVFALETRKAEAAARPALLVAFGALMRVSARAAAATAPILAAHAMPVVPAGLVANAIAVPLVSFVFLPLALATATLTSGDGSFSNAWLEHACSITECFLGLVEWAALQAPVAAARPAPSAPFLALGGALAISAMRLRSTASVVLLSLAIAALLRFAPPAPSFPEPPRIVAFDVGLGDAVLVEGREATLLVDAGAAIDGRLDLGRSVVVPALDALGVDTVDVLVASHSDADHRGGLLAVLESRPIGELWLPPGGGAADAFDELVSRARARGVRIVEPALGDRPRERGDLRIDTLWPPRDGHGRSTNDASLVLRVEAAGRRILLTGDVGAQVERALLRKPRALAADVLKVAHHGSRKGSTSPFLDAVGADLAIVSAACSPRVALPSQEALSRLERAGGSTWWTGRDGAVLVSLGRPDLSAWGWLERSRYACRQATPGWQSNGRGRLFAR